MERVSPGSPVWRLIGLLGDDVRRQGSGWSAHCPGPNHKHGDRHASLSVGSGDDGRALLHCQAGCSTEDVLKALGLEYSALFERDRQGDRVRRFNLYENGHVVATHVRVDRANGKDLYWQRNGKNGLDGLPLADLPLYGAAHLDERPDEAVYLCEGEQAAQALLDLGLLAVATVTGAATIPSDGALAALAGRQVRLWPDNDPEGLSHMMAIAARLVTSAVAWVRWPEAPEHGDAADYAAMGGTPGDLDYLVVEADDPNGEQEGVDADELMKMDFDDPRWAVPGVLPEGVALFAGKSKLGKSWMALDIGWAVAAGGLLWGTIRCPQGDVLYLALEDSLRRLQGRLRMVGGRPPANLWLQVAWPRADEGGTERIVRWLQNHKNARLIIIDVLEKFRPRTKGKADADLYRRDYDTIAPIAELARGRGVCILVIHHCNKRIDPEDPLDSISGTTGLVGAADVVGVFRRERLKENVASLLVTGRDIEEQEMALEFVLGEHAGTAWKYAGSAAQVRMSQERKLILAEVSRDPGQKPHVYAERLGQRASNVRKNMWVMVRDGQLRLIDQGYYPPLTTHSGNSANSGNDSGVQVDSVTRGVTVTPVQKPLPPSGTVTGQGVTSATSATNTTTASYGTGVTRLCRWCGQAMPHLPHDKCRFPEDQP